MARTTICGIIVLSRKKEATIMPRKATAITLRDGDYEYLRSLIKQRTIQAQVVIRAHILLDKENIRTVLIAIH